MEPPRAAVLIPALLVLAGGAAISGPSLAVGGVADEFAAPNTMVLSPCARWSTGPVSGIVRPMADEPGLVLDEVDVAIDLFPDHAEVDSTFVLRNMGERATARIGIPEYGTQDASLTQPPRLVGVTVWMDGEEVEPDTRRLQTTEVGPSAVGLEGREGPQEHAQMEWSRWRIVPAAFGAGRKRTLRVRFQSELGRSGAGCRPERQFRYGLVTAAHWAAPIGSARVSVELHHGACNGWFQLLAPEFRRTGPASFDWQAQDFDPRGEPDMSIGYNRFGGDVYVGPGHIHPGGPPYPRLRDGRLWAQVRNLADWMRCDLEVRGTTATLHADDTTVTLRAGSPWMQSGEERVRLVHPPRLEQGVLVAPVASVARAFGFYSGFDPRTRTVRLIPPVLPIAGLRSRDGGTPPAEAPVRGRASDSAARHR